MAQFFLPHDKMKSLQERVDRVNKYLEKQKIEKRLSVDQIGEETRYWKPEYHPSKGHLLGFTLLNEGAITESERKTLMSVRVLRVNVNDDDLVVNRDGWALVGKSELIDGRVLTSFAQHNVDQHTIAEVDARLEGVDCFDCDHCKTKRGRKNAILMKNPAGRLEVVGTDCAEVYTGMNAAALLGAMRLWKPERGGADEEMLWDMIDDPFGGAGAAPSWRGFTPQVMLAAAMYARETGFYARAADFRAGDVVLSLGAEALGIVVGGEPAQGFFDYMERAVERADIIREMCSKSPENAFFYTAAQALDLSIIPKKNERQLAGLIAAADKSVDKYLQRLADAQKSAYSEHQGVVGEKREMQLIFSRANFFEGQYGVQAINTLHDLDGNEYKWSSSTAFKSLIPVGFEQRSVLVSAKIKRHSVYKDIKQTELSHVKVLSLTPELVAQNPSGQLAIVLNDVFDLSRSAKHIQRCEPSLFSLEPAFHHLVGAGLSSALSRLVDEKDARLWAQTIFSPESGLLLRSIYAAPRLRSDDLDGRNPLGEIVFINKDEVLPPHSVAIIFPHDISKKKNIKPVLEQIANAGKSLAGGVVACLASLEEAGCNIVFAENRLKAALFRGELFDKANHAVSFVANMVADGHREKMRAFFAGEQLEDEEDLIDEMMSDRPHQNNDAVLDDVAALIGVSALTDCVDNLLNDDDHSLSI